MNPEIASTQVMPRLKIVTDFTCYIFHCYQQILIILAGIIHEACAVISLFNFSYMFTITSLTCCEFTKAEMTHFLMSPVVCEHAN